MLVQRELRRELEKRIKQNASVSDEWQIGPPPSSAHCAALLLSVLLLNNLAGHQDQTEAMHWLLEAAWAGSNQARLDILRVSWALDYQHHVDVQDLLSSWLRDSTIS